MPDVVHTATCKHVAFGTLLPTFLHCHSTDPLAVCASGMASQNFEGVAAVAFVHEETQLRGKPRLLQILFMTPLRLSCLENWLPTCVQWPGLAIHRKLQKHCFSYVAQACPSLSCSSWKHTNAHKASASMQIVATTQTLHPLFPMLRDPCIYCHSITHGKAGCHALTCVLCVHRHGGIDSHRHIKLSQLRG